jgi:ComF family protein
MSEFLTSFLDFFLPRFCAGCRKKLTANEKVVCAVCFNSIKVVSEEIRLSEYSRKFSQSKIIDDFFSFFVFEQGKVLQNIIHSMKYRNRFLIGSFLGTQAGIEFSDKLKNLNLDFICPVPLHQLKKAERGYNQAFYIAKGLSRQVKIPLNAGLIKRKKFTQTQTKMNAKEREENIKDAFFIKNKNKVRGKNFLLIDDLITTGSTVKECGRVLKDSGANKVYAFSIAIPMQAEQFIGA